MYRWTTLVFVSVLACGCAKKRTVMPDGEMPEVAHAVMNGLQGTRAGSVLLVERADGVELKVDVRLPIGSGQHGFHIHEGTSCGGDMFADAGGHFNPDPDEPHGAPSSERHHAGDMGNLRSDDRGHVEARMVVEGVTLSRGRTQIIGHPIVIHSGADDFVSQPSGNSGRKVLCGVITEGPMPEM